MPKPTAAKMKAKAKKAKAKAKAKSGIIAKAQRKVAGAAGFAGKTPDRTPRKKKPTTTT